MDPGILFFIWRKSKSRTCIFNLCPLLVVLISAIFFFSSCVNNDAKPVPRREVSVYNERIIPAVSPYELSIECDYGNFEFYNWDKKEVKFEITHKVRAGRMKTELDKMLERFSISTSEEAGKISLKCSYNGKDGNYEDTFSVVRIFMPGKSSFIDCTLRHGKLKFFDDLNCGLKLDVGNAEVEINRLKGIIKYTGKTGNLRISSGEIYSDSSIVTSTGNIRVKSCFESPGQYTFNTGAGIIELDLPADLNAVIESNGKITANEASGSDPCSKFLLKCGVGKIDINRF